MYYAYELVHFFEVQMILTTSSEKVLKKILYVEDEESIRMALDEYFTILGYSVVTAEEGNQALNLMKSEKFDLIITDINMPNGMGGIELINKIAEIDKNIPIVAISGYLRNSEQLDALPKETTYFSKPVTMRILCSKIKEILK